MTLAHAAPVQVPTVSDVVAAHAVASGDRVVVGFYQRLESRAPEDESRLRVLRARMLDLVDRLGPDVQVCAVDVGEGASVLARVAGVSATPAVVAFTGVRPVFRHVGDTERVEDLARRMRAAMAP